MELDGELFSGALLWWIAGLYGMVLLYALRMAPWSRLARKGQLHVFLGAIVALIVLWHIRAQLQPGISFHLLGVTAITLMFGWSMAIIMASLALLAVCVNAGYGWQGYVVSFLTVALVPITLSQISLILIRSWLPRQFFVYVLGNGFFYRLAGRLCKWLSGDASAGSQWRLHHGGVASHGDALLPLDVLPGSPGQRLGDHPDGGVLSHLGLLLQR